MAEAFYAGQTDYINVLNIMNDSYDGATADAAAAAASAAAALVSEGNAATSETNADNDAIQVAADLVLTNQDTIDTAADLVATNQDTIDTASDLVLTNADVVTTNADVVLTNADVVSAAASAAKLTGTSTTSLLIELLASKVFVTQSDKSFEAGRWLLITSDADPSNYMTGQVTSYSGTSLTVYITNIGGSGTFADWTITVSGARGINGSDLDWTVDQGASNIHANNYVDNNTTDHTSFSNIGTNTHAQIDTHISLSNEHLDWAADQGGTNIHTGNYIDWSVDQGATDIHKDNIPLDILHATALSF